MKGKINVQTNKLAEQGLTIKEQYAEIKKSTLLEQIKEGTPHCWSRSNIKYSNRINMQNKYP
jgi:hypothetical protein